MAIFTKDGKVYVLQGPNPLVEKQASWDPSKLVLHNLSWEEIRTGGKRPPQKPPEIPDTNPNPKQEQDVQKGIEKAGDPINAPKEKDEEPHETADNEFELPYIKYKVLCHCLPAKVENRNDPFYGETWSRVTYGKKFVFPCVIISSNDLSLEFWTSDPDGKISERSVIYPFSYEVHNQDTDAYDRVPYDDYRWWKVTSKEPKEGGWLFSSAPSDINPDFSD